MALTCCTETSPRSRTTAGCTWKWGAIQAARPALVQVLHGQVCHVFDVDQFEAVAAQVLHGEPCIILTQVQVVAVEGRLAVHAPAAAQGVVARLEGCEFVDDGRELVGRPEQVTRPA